MPLSPRGTNCRQLRKAAATDFTATAYAVTLTPTTTKPSGNGVIDLYSESYGISDRLLQIVDKFMFLMPYGSNAANEDFEFRVWGWQQCDSELSGLWVPTLLGAFDVTLGNIAAAALGTDMYLADTIAEVAGDSDGGVMLQTVSPTNDLPGSISVHLRGCSLLQFDFDLDSGPIPTAAASANCLWRTFS